MRWYKRKGLVALLIICAIICMLITAISMYFNYWFDVERTYPEILEMYKLCREKSEEIYALMLPYVESNGLGLEWYGCSSGITPWQPEAEVILRELEGEYIGLKGMMTSNAIDFYKRGVENWCIRINVGGVNGHHVFIYYSPYDELPYNDSQQLEGMAYGWSFTASRNP